MNTGSSNQKGNEEANLLGEVDVRTRPFWRFFLIGFGWFNVGLAAIGVIVPGIPTTIFLIIALWSFSQSSTRLHSWLFNHRVFGPFLQNWKRHGVIPRRAKRVAILMILGSWALLIYTSKSWILGGGVGLVMFCVVVFIATRPSSPCSG